MAITLTLKNGKTVDIRERLKVRHTQDAAEYSDLRVSSDRKDLSVNVVKSRVANTAVRIMSWTLTDDDGKSIHWPQLDFKKQCEVLTSLWDDQFDEVATAVSAEVEKIDALRVAEKNAIADGENELTTSSPSAS